MKTNPILGAVAASVMLSAAAQAGPADERRAYSVELRGPFAPIAHGELRYPRLALVRQREGACVIRFGETTGGRPNAVSKPDCTDRLFRGAAQRVARQLMFDASADAAPDEARYVVIEWALSTEKPRAGR